MCLLSSFHTESLMFSICNWDQAHVKRWVEGPVHTHGQTYCPPASEPHALRPYPWSEPAAQVPLAPTPSPRCSCKEGSVMGSLDARGTGARLPKPSPGPRVLPPTGCQSPEDRQAMGEGYGSPKPLRLLTTDGWQT